VTPKRHAMAVTLAVMPSVAQLIQIFLSQVYNGALMSAAIDPAGTMKATGITNPDFIKTCAVMILLAHGFILTAMLWGGAVAFLIDRRPMAAVTTLVACAVLAFFGFIHSITRREGSTSLEDGIDTAVPLDGGVPGVRATDIWLVEDQGIPRQSGSGSLTAQQRVTPTPGVRRPFRTRFPFDSHEFSNLGGTENGLANGRRMPAYEKRALEGALGEMTARNDEQESGVAHDFPPTPHGANT
jgi:hypothetical protein